MQSRTVDTVAFVGHGGGDDFRGEIATLLARLDWRKAGIALGVTLFAAVCVALRQELGTITWDQVRSAMQELPATSILAACAATALSYLALVGVDYLALRQSGTTTVPPLFVAFTSFISHCFTFTLGFGVLTGGAVRLRL